MENEKRELKENLDKAILDRDSFLVSWYGSELQAIYAMEQRSQERQAEWKIKLDNLRAECDSKAEDLMTQIRIFGKIVYGRK